MIDPATPHALQNRPTLGGQIALFILCGPLNPALLLAGYLHEVDVFSLSVSLPHFSMAVFHRRLPVVIGPAVMMAIIAIHRLHRADSVDHAAIARAWWRGYWVSVAAAPFYFGVFMGLFGILRQPADTLELLIMAPMVSIMGLIVGWLSLIIPFIAIVIGLPALVYAILLTHAWGWMAELRDRNDVPTP